MKKFIIKTSAFLALILFFLIGFELVTSEFIKHNSCFTIDNKPKYLVLGDSQPEHAFNDSLINGLKNLAQGGESYFWTYHKAKKVIEQNPSIDTVFIAFKNNNIELKRDAWTWDCYYMESRLDRFSPLLNTNAKLYLAFNNFSCFSKTMVYELKERWLRLISLDMSFKENLGGYKVSIKKKPKTESELSKEAKRVKKINEFNPNEQAVSMHNLKYLKKIIALCKDQGKQVVLVRPPQHKNYVFRKNEDLFNQVRKDYLNEISFLDFNDFPLSDDGFIDDGHLSYEGAKFFSIYFDKILRNKKNIDMSSIP